MAISRSEQQTVILKHFSSRGVFNQQFRFRLDVRIVQQLRSFRICSLARCFLSIVDANIKLLFNMSTFSSFNRKHDARRNPLLLRCNVVHSGYRVASIAIL